LVAGCKGIADDNGSANIVSDEGGPGMQAVTTVNASGGTQSTGGIRPARWIFWLAGLYGVAVLLPQYFLLEQIGRDTPPPVTHVEYFYGFVGLALVWQIAFFVIGQHPVRYRAFMPVAVLEKLSFGIPCAVLFVRGQLPKSVFVFGIIDLTLAAAFVVAWVAAGVATRSDSVNSSTRGEA
jgi:hypothetical protein